VKVGKQEVVQDLVYCGINSSCHNNCCRCQNRDGTGGRGLEGNRYFKTK
jgi:hypothetical protein